MTNRPGDADTDLLTGLDIRAFWATVRLRWWVIPAALALSIGFLWAQESDLRTEPGSYYITRTFEARDPTAVLASVGIDPVSVRAFPDANNQLLVLQSAAVRNEIAEQLGKNVPVTVSRSRPSFSLIDTLESDGQSSFVFQSAGVPTYTFTCNEPVKAECEAAIDAYVMKAAEIRRESFSAGIADLRAVLEAVNDSGADAAGSTKLKALTVLEERLDTTFVEIATFEDAIGSTVTSIRRSTYTFGVAAGLVIALLILLQLTVTDRKIRSLPQLVRLVKAEHVLGRVQKTQEPVGDRRVALGIRRQLESSSATHVRIIPIRPVAEADHLLVHVSELTGTSFTIESPFRELAVLKLTRSENNRIDVLMVQRNRDLRHEVRDAYAALVGLPNFAGLILVD